MSDINRNSTIDRAERYHDDKQLDQYALPALNDDRAERQKRDLFYVPGQPYGWLVVGMLLLNVPNVLALIFWLEFIPNTVLFFSALISSGLVGGGIVNQVPAKRLAILGLIFGVGVTVAQYHHEPVEAINEQLSNWKEELWTAKQK